MRNKVFKFLPYVVGGVLGWMLLNPPGWSASLGPWRQPLTDGVIQGDLSRLRQQFHDLSFVQTGPPSRVGITPAAVMIAFVHKKEPVFGVIYETGTLPCASADWPPGRSTPQASPSTFKNRCAASTKWRGPRLYGGRPSHSGAPSPELPHTWDQFVRSASPSARSKSCLAGGLPPPNS